MGDNIGVALMWFGAMLGFGVTVVAFYERRRAASIIRGLRDRLAQAEGALWRGTVDFVFDGPPSPEGPRFVEVEDMAGWSLRLGKWVRRDDGYWALRVYGSRDRELRVQELEGSLALAREELDALSRVLLRLGFESVTYEPGSAPT